MTSSSLQVIVVSIDSHYNDMTEETFRSVHGALRLKRSMRVDEETPMERSGVHVTATADAMTTTQATMSHTEDAMDSNNSRESMLRGNMNDVSGRGRVCEGHTRSSSPYKRRLVTISFFISLSHQQHLTRVQYLQQQFQSSTNVFVQYLHFVFHTGLLLIIIEG